MSSEIICPVCCKTFCNSSNLRCHIKNFHPDKIKEISLNKMKYKCEFCSEGFKNQTLFKKHRNVHLYALQCPLCTFSNFKPAVIDHFSSVHNVDMKTEHIDFTTIEQFESWKKQIEANDRVSFISYHGTSINTGYSRTVYVCSRSGKFETKGNGIRRLKKQGSKKINGFCPAAINVIFKNDIYSVEYTSTHIGHKNDLCHIKLHECDKLMLADQIALNVPFDNILDDVRDSANNSELERIHLVTKQDLKNIKRNLISNNSSIPDEKDVDSIDISTSIKVKEE